jgi:transcriptional regulator with XRE-family HTH domain
MNYKNYFKKFENDTEYKNAKEKFGTVLDIGDEILRLRIEKGWSQAELAESAGTKQANISRLESGLNNPSINFLQKVAKALDTTMSVHFEKVTVPQVKIKTEAENQSIYVPNWPHAETYKYYHSSSTRRSHD